MPKARLTARRAVCLFGRGSYSRQSWRGQGAGSDYDSYLSGARMGIDRFLVIALTGGMVAAALLILARTLDAPVLYLPALLAVLGILIARESWLWEGDRRGWILMVGTLAATILVLFFLQRVTS